MMTVKPVSGRLRAAVAALVLGAGLVLALGGCGNHQTTQSPTTSPGQTQTQQGNGNGNSGTSGQLQDVQNQLNNIGSSIGSLNTDQSNSDANSTTQEQEQQP